MSSQRFIPQAYSLSVQDLLPPEACEETGDDPQWQEYCQVSKTLNVDDVMAVVGDLFSQSPLLRQLVEETLANPFEPGERKRLHIDDCLKLGAEVATLIAQAADDAVGLRQACE